MQAVAHALNRVEFYNELLRFYGIGETDAICRHIGTLLPLCAARTDNYTDGIEWAKHANCAKEAFIKGEAVAWADAKD